MTGSQIVMLISVVALFVFVGWAIRTVRRAEQKRRQTQHRARRPNAGIDGQEATRATLKGLYGGQDTN